MSSRKGEEAVRVSVSAQMEQIAAGQWDQIRALVRDAMERMGEDHCAQQLFSRRCTEVVYALSAHAGELARKSQEG